MISVRQKSTAISTLCKNKIAPTKRKKCSITPVQIAHELLPYKMVLCWQYRRTPYITFSRKHLNSQLSQILFLSESICCVTKCMWSWLLSL